MEAHFTEIAVKVGKVAYRIAEAKQPAGSWKTDKELSREISAIVEKAFNDYAIELSREMEVPENVVSILR